MSGPRIPELWWSPAECSVYADREGAAPHYLTMRDTGRLGQLPPDAVQLVGPDQRRPVVLLRADDCDCGPPYADCPHGPEPVDALDLAVWLHAESVWQREHARNLFLDHYNAASSTADRVGELEAALRERTADRDALQARIDAAVRWLDDPQDLTPAGQLYQVRAALQGDQPAAGSKYRDVELAYWRGRAETAEQRLKDAANFYPAVPPEPPVGTTYSNPDGSTAWVRREDGWHCGRTEPCRNCPCEWQEAWDFGIRDPKLTRILGDQPTEPVKRCCIGPFADGTHAINCWQRCQDCGGDETTCRCRDAAQPTEGTTP